MAKNEKTGVYSITCAATNAVYIGASVRIYSRWSQHRGLLRTGKNPCSLLQQAWTQFGEAAFVFAIIEECAADALRQREQFYIDSMNPALNSVTCIKTQSGPMQRANMADALRARAALITHCPRGHAYDERNTYLNKKGKRICRACNAQRVAAVYARETPEQTARRAAVKAAYHQRMKAA